MGNSQKRLSTLEELFQQTIKDRENLFVQINKVGKSSYLDTHTLQDEITLIKKEDEIGQITIWKRYEVLMFPFLKLKFKIETRKIIF